MFTKKENVFQGNLVTVNCDWKQEDKDLLIRIVSHTGVRGDTDPRTLPPHPRLGFHSISIVAFTIKPVSGWNVPLLPARTRIRLGRPCSWLSLEWYLPPPPPHEKILFLASLKSLMKGVWSGVGSGSEDPDSTEMSWIPNSGGWVQFQWHCLYMFHARYHTIPAPLLFTQRKNGETNLPSLLLFSVFPAFTQFSINFSSFLHVFRSFPSLLP